MKGRICLCPASIAWIRKHLMKSARRTFTKMISTGSIKNVARRVKSHRKHFSRKQLAAQRLFAKRARAGTLRGRRKRRSRNSRR